MASIDTILDELRRFSSSAFALYIERFAYYCGFISRHADFGCTVEGESTSDYTFTPCVGSFACPGISVLRLFQTNFASA
jgi:hypothetical protein